MSITQLLFAGYANPLVAVDSAKFDGSTAYLTRGAGFTGAADSKSGIFSAWVRFDGADGVLTAIFNIVTTLGGGASQFTAIKLSNNVFRLIGWNSASSAILVINTTGTFVAGATWRHFLGSWDLSVAAANLYVNDVSDLAGGSTLTNDTIDYTSADSGIGALPDGTFKFNGCLAELYFAPGQYLDFSNVYNRRKFISASGKPVSLGANGALPTGVAPIVYEHLNVGELASDFAVNLGTGGGFTVHGSLTTGSTSPSS